MQRVNLTPDLTFSRLVYGMWRIGDDADTSPKHVQAKIEACLAQGITTMDQADIYGGYTAEAILGNALKASPGLRDKLEIVTKCDIVAPVGRHSAARVKYYDTSAAHITASVEASLTDMGTDHVDLLLIHRPDPLIDPDETGPALDALVASGKVRAVGVSNFRPWDFSLLQSSMENNLVTNQIEMSLLATDTFVNGDLAYLQERMVSPMAWSPLGGGRLLDGSKPELLSALKRIGAENGVDETAVAGAWLLRHPATIMPVMGTNSLDRIAKIADATKVELDRQTWFELYTLAIGQEVA
ncbi:MULTISPECIES: aldo/keto reductase [unclassified Agrobacterium]|uniref:aldo/keto reductase n=1 Tax=unclassified Agrobacterium TaxID=2632611 RepID=UPI00083E61EE|nr:MULTISPECIES: aldo/keto reductase [unclassified Agrobacterium]AOG09316.1 aldo/keto reductase family protein [Agrobacterium sp. RAC06]QGG91896.1 oxidoreductase [Agrobacterium sp. MA01]